MIKQLTLAAALLLSATPALAQEQTCREGATCTCDSLVDRAGVLNTTHCDAGRVKEILARYARGLGGMLPEKVRPEDLRLAASKRVSLERETVEAMLSLMTLEELRSLFPPLVPTDGGRPGPSRPGNNPHGPLSDCDKAVYWINTGLLKMDQVDSLVVQFALETSLYNPADPYLQLFCNPQLLYASSTYLSSSSLIGPVRQWLQLAADAMSNGLPGVAVWDSAAAWWLAVQASWGHIVAYNYPPIDNDARCSEVSAIGLLLAEVAQAAREGYEWAGECAGGGTN
jgi:hypothetical protein